MDFACARGGGGRKTRAAVTQRARIKCVALDKPSDARLRNQGRVAEQGVRKRFIYDLPVSVPYHKSGTGAEFYKTNISKKGRR